VLLLLLLLLLLSYCRGAAAGRTQTRGGYPAQKISLEIAHGAYFKNGDVVVIALLHGRKETDICGYRHRSGTTYLSANVSVGKRKFSARNTFCRAVARAGAGPLPSGNLRRPVSPLGPSREVLSVRGP